MRRSATRWLATGAIAAIGAIAAGACKKDKAPPSPELEIARRIASEERLEIEQALADARANNPARPVERGFDACKAVLGVLATLRASPEVQLALTLEELCGRELPLAELTAAVDAVEGDAAACARTRQVPLARTALELAGRLDDAAVKLIARYEARCPRS